ncbi:nuclease-related domain-containing protein [Conexibacter sp. DBS9H8]|uniref:nuclease-related domain-containing protein n=1 Tax=Conexibacter sp. DBS9H8 TaxID=2937801 RepID=UPI00200D8E1D|nr:nuclease-related domain-containing protein [Conexibacter sp. DBS9H8]
MRLEPIGEPASLQQRRFDSSQARGRPARNTIKGIEGERRVSEELAVALANTGAILINSLQFLHWGDIDHLIIGPGGITVVDAKNWTGEISVVDGIPRVGTRKKYDKLEGLLRQRAGVRIALTAARASVRNTSVQAVMCFADDPGRPVSQLAGGVVLSGSSAAGVIAGRGGPLTPEDIQHLQTVLMAELPKVHRDQIDAFMAETEQAAARLDDLPRRFTPSRRREANVSPLGQSHQRPQPSRGPKRSRSGRSSSRSRRARSRTERDVAVLIAMLFVGGAYWLVHGSTASSLSGLGVMNGWPARITFDAPASASVELAVFRRGHPTRATTVTAVGSTQTWQLPLAWTRRAHSFTVEACILNSKRRCAAGTTIASSARWSGSKLLGWQPT